ncbi:class I SAM-dependent methyltransferase [Sphaerotilus montanus]|uniref:class I SAM-dependent methyltransferase n=1 Tax=Sphaerotilus montanus TaxID=522889 RepID=UPI003FA2C122
MTKSPSIAEMHSPYFVQRVSIGNELAGRSRQDVFSQICKNRRVLHIGCADWPITNVQNSLHVQLENVCAHLDGFDIHVESLDMLRPHVKGSLYSDWNDITGQYDVILIPEVLEHVPDVKSFLEKIDSINAGDIILTVPDAFQCARRHFEYQEQGEEFIEIVHPDHNFWYTPYTIKNTITKYTSWKIDGLWFFNNISILAVINKQR